jgi:hypothetical protein
MKKIINLKIRRNDSTSLTIQPNIQITDELCNPKDNYFIANSIFDLQGKIEDLFFTEKCLNLNDFDILINSRVFAKKRIGNNDLIFDKKVKNLLTIKYKTSEKLNFVLTKSKTGFIVELQTDKKAYFNKSDNLIICMNKKQIFLTPEEALKSINFYMVDMNADIKNINRYDISVNDIPHMFLKDNIKFIKNNAIEIIASINKLH